MFDGHPITIIPHTNEDRKQYLFLANDVGKVLDIKNIRTAIQHFDEDERCTDTVQTAFGGCQNATYLTSHGVYRLLYSSKSPLAKKFRSWVGNILDDIIFQEARQLRQLVANYEEQLDELRNENNQVVSDILVKTYDKKPVLYLGYISYDIVKFGTTGKLRHRLATHKHNFKEFRLVEVIESVHNRVIESKLKKAVRDHQILMTVNGVQCTELVKLDDTFSYEELRALVINIKTKVERSNDRDFEMLQAQLDLTKTQYKLQRLQLLTGSTTSRICTQSSDSESESESDTDVAPPQQRTSQTKKPPVRLIPTIPEPESIAEAWSAWNETLKPYFSVVAKPPWKAQNKQQYMMRYYRLEYFGLYVDWAIQQTQLTAEAVLAILSEIAHAYGDAEKTFITSSLYVCIYRQGQSYEEGRKAHVRIPPEKVAAELQRKGLPIPSVGIKDMRRMFIGRPLARKRDTS